MTSKPSAAPRSHWLRRLIIGVVLVILLVALLAALAPTLVSSGPGTRLALSIANGYIPGTISAELLSVGWFSGAHIEGLKITQPDGKVVVNAGVSAPDFSLSRAAGGATDFGVITVTNPTINFEQYSDGTNSITRALVKVAKAAAPAQPAPGQTNTNYRAKLVLTGGTVKFVTPGQAPVTVENLSINAQVTTLAALTADLKASVKQGQNSGQIELKKCSVTNLFDSTGNLQADRAAFDVDARLTDLPIAMADALASTSGNLVALLGDKADAEFTVAGSLANLTGHVKFTTTKLTSMADVTATKTDVTAGASVHLAVDPATWARLTATTSGAPLLPAITKPAVFDLTLDKTTEPIRNSRIDLAAILNKITIKPIELAFENSSGAATGAATFAMTANQISLTIPPPLAGFIAHQQTAGNPDLAKLSLAEPLTVNATVNELVLTTGASSGFTFKAKIASPKIAAVGLPQLGAVTVTGLAAELSGESAGGKTKASATLGLQEIAFPTDQQLSTTRLSNLKLSVPAVSSGGELKASFSTDILHGEEKGTLAANVDLTPGQPLAFSASTTAVNLPLDLADILANQHGKLVAIAGPKVENFTASATSDPADKGAIHFSLDAKTAHLAAKFAGLVAPQDRFEMHDSSVTLGLTPQSFDALMSVTSSVQTVSLQQNSQATVTIASLLVPLPKAAPAGQSDPFTLDPERTKADITIALPQAAFKLAETGDVVSLKDFSARLSTQNPAKETTALITAQFSSSGAAGVIDSHTTITNLVDAKGHLQLSSAAIDTDTKLKEVPLQLIDALAGLGGKLVRSLGPTMHQLELTAKSAGQNQPINFSVAAQAQFLDAKLSGTFTPGQELSISKGSYATLTITDDTLAMLQPAGVPSATASSATISAPSARAVALQQNSQATVTIAAILVPLPKTAPAGQPAPFTLDPERTKADLTIAIPQAAFKLAETGDVVALKDFSAHLSTQNPAKETTALITAQFNTSGAAGAIDSHTTITNLVDAKGHLQLSSAALDTNTKLKEVPLRLIDALAGLGGKLVRSLGPTMNQLDLTAKSAGRDQPIAFTVVAQSQFLDANLGGAFTPGQGLVVTKGSAASLTLTDDTLAMLQPTAAPADRKLSLQKSAKYRLAIADAELAWPAVKPSPSGEGGPSGPGEGLRPKTSPPAQPLRIDPAHTRFNIELTGEPTALLLRDSGESATFSNLKFSVQTDNPAAGTVADIHFDVQIGKTGETPVTGKFDSKTTLKNLVSSDGLLQVAKASITSETSLDNVPTTPLDALAATNGKLAELLGPTLAASVSTNYQPNVGGPVHVKLTSANTQGDLPFTLDKDTVLHLSQDAKVSAKLTPGLSKNLGLASPLLFQAVQSDKPIQIFLRSNAFAVPLSPVDLAKARVDGEVDLGTVTMQNAGLLKLTTLMLSQLGSTAPQGDTMPATFTPLVFHLDKGIITTNDMWLSSPLLTMGTQAVSVDLNPALRPGQPFNASLVPARILIGLSGRDLARVKELQGTFDPNYVYEIPATGPVDAIKPDYGKFVAQIAELKAKAAAQKQLKGLGSLGGAMGSKVLGAAPQADQQAEIQKHWPNMPKAPATATTPAVNQPAAPTTPPPPPPPAPQPQKPGLPKLPKLPF